MADAGAAEGDSGVVESLEDNFVLEIGVGLDGDSGEHVNVLDLFTSEEVLHINARAVGGDDAVDGEMGVYGSHFVLETLSNTDEHVEDEGFESVGGASLLVPTEPHSNSNVLALSVLFVKVNELNFTGHMGEILGNLTTGSFNSHFP